MSKERGPNMALGAGFKDARTWDTAQVMTFGGTFTKILILFLVLLGGAYVQVSQSSVGAISPLFYGGLIGGFVLAIYTIFNPTHAIVTAPIYAFCEGLVLAGVSLIAESQYPGLSILAITLTLGLTAGMLGLYTSRIVKNSPRFTKMITGAMFGIVAIYLVTMVAQLFGTQFPFLHTLISGGGWLSVGFSAFVVGIATFSLVIDFDFVETQVENGAPARMEWYAAFGIMVTLVWLYLEVLRLLINLRAASDD